MLVNILISLISVMISIAFIKFWLFLVFLHYIEVSYEKSNKFKVINNLFTRLKQVLMIMLK